LSNLNEEKDNLIAKNEKQTIEIESSDNSDEDDEDFDPEADSDSFSGEDGSDSSFDDDDDDDDDDSSNSSDDDDDDDDDDEDDDANSDVCSSVCSGDVEIANLSGENDNNYLKRKKRNSDEANFTSKNDDNLENVEFKKEIVLVSPEDSKRIKIGQ
jgi:hypothetical protein